MTFRITTNGQKFRVQYRYWLWPFWFTEKRATESGWYFEEWVTREEAFGHIDKCCKKIKQDAQRWVPL